MSAQADVATWVSAAGTVAAAIVPLVLFLRERKDRQAAEVKLRQREENDLENSKRAQARLVHAWFESSKTLTSGNAFFQVSNTSSSPITHMYIFAHLDVIINDGNVNKITTDIKEGYVFVPVVPPTGTSFINLDMGDAYASMSDSNPILDVYPPGSYIMGGEIKSVTFDDADGFNWERNAQGNLHLSDGSR